MNLNPVTSRSFRSLLLSVSLLLVSSILIGGVVAQEVPEPIDTVSVDSLDELALTALTPEPPTNLVGRDSPNDAGGAVRLSWDLSPSDSLGGLVAEYKIYRAENPDGPYEQIGTGPQGRSEYRDNEAETGVEYFYKVAAANFEKLDREFVFEVDAETVPIGPIKSTAQWFNTGRLNSFVGIIVLSSAIIYFILAAKKGRELYVRKIAGIEEVENAVGRATEMGRAIYYIPGIMDMDDVQTLASITILGRVSEIAAENDTRIDVPVAKSMVMVTAFETVKEAYSKVGRPDSFMNNQVRYLTDDQFGYAAAIDGLFVREKPAAIFLIGAFFAESLIMAETGNSIGAIQIAGTAMPSQLPFFVAACDYTLIGEELFAASAYLSREPKMLGSLKGQDIGKAVFLTAIVIGILVEVLGYNAHQLFTVQ